MEKKKLTKVFGLKDAARLRTNFDDGKASRLLKTIDTLVTGGGDGYSMEELLDASIFLSSVQGIIEKQIGRKGVEDFILSVLEYLRSCGEPYDRLENQMLESSIYSYLAKTETKTDDGIFMIIRACCVENQSPEHLTVEDKIKALAEVSDSNDINILRYDPDGSFSETISGYINEGANPDDMVEEIKRECKKLYLRLPPAPPRETALETGIRFHNMDIFSKAVYLPPDREGGSMRWAGTIRQEGKDSQIIFSLETLDGKTPSGHDMRVLEVVSSIYEKMAGADGAACVSANTIWRVFYGKTDKKTVRIPPDQVEKIKESLRFLKNTRARIFVERTENGQLIREETNLLDYSTIQGRSSHGGGFETLYRIKTPPLLMSACLQCGTTIYIEPQYLLADDSGKSSTTTRQLMYLRIAERAKGYQIEKFDSNTIRLDSVLKELNIRQDMGIPDGVPNCAVRRAKKREQFRRDFKAGMDKAKNNGLITEYRYDGKEDKATFSAQRQKQQK